jgi:hypothetical protein
MSTPTAQVARKGPADVDKPVEPTAMANGETVAKHGVGEILKTLVHHSLAFPTEDSTNAAFLAVDKWVGDTAGMDTDNARAPIEDVSQRIPPGGVTPTSVVQGPVIDYNKLAQAILAAQKEADKK